MKSEPSGSSSPESLSSFPLSSPGDLVIAYNHTAPHQTLHSNSTNTQNNNNNLSINHNTSAQSGLIATASNSAKTNSNSNNSNNNNENIEGSASSSSVDSNMLSKTSFQFKNEQIDCVCEALLQAKDYEKLGQFLSSLPMSTEITCTSEILQRAKVSVAFYRGAFKEVYNILESHNFHGKYHAELQNVWYKAHYKEAEKIRQRPLGKYIFWCIRL